MILKTTLIRSAKFYKVGEFSLGERKLGTHAHHKIRDLYRIGATRILNDYTKCVSTLSYGHRSFRKASADLWNKLPQHIKYCQTINQFKTSLKTHLFTMAFDD